MKKIQYLNSAPKGYFDNMAMQLGRWRLLPVCHPHTLVVKQTVTSIRGLQAKDVITSPINDERYESRDKPLKNAFSFTDF